MACSRQRVYRKIAVSVPLNPKIYHIVHVDRLPSIISDNFIWCDAAMVAQQKPGTAIGLNGIKRRRLYELTLESHPGLHVGECTPFYLCPRSVMLFLIHCANHEELTYRDGQGSIIHLEADLRQTTAWASEQGLRWAFTLSNAGSTYFEDRCDLRQLSEINWDAVRTNSWSGRGIAPFVKEGKQAEFLVENRFPWHLVERVGVHSDRIQAFVNRAMQNSNHKPAVARLPEWSY